MKLRITTDGRIIALLNDALDLGAIGRLRVRRASHVEFDNPTQLWCVRRVERFHLLRGVMRWLLRRPGSGVLFAAPSRAEALMWEEENLGV